MPPSEEVGHEEIVVSQVLLILIRLKMTYCLGEGDCHGATRIGEGKGSEWGRTGSDQGTLLSSL